jgi:hypothetical protein
VTSVGRRLSHAHANVPDTKLGLFCTSEFSKYCRGGGLQFVLYGALVRTVKILVCDCVC